MDLDSDSSDVNSDSGMDIFSESICSPLFPVLKHLDSTHSDKNKTFADNIEALVLTWHRIVDFILVQPSSKVNEEVFEYVYPQTINILLHSGWLTVDQTVKEHLSTIFEKCLSYFERFNSVSVINIKSLICLVESPWDDTTLKQIINNYNEVSREDLISFFKSENLLLISTRIKILIKSKSEDLALKLVNAVVKFTGILPSSWIDVYIRVMTTNINLIEKCRSQDDLDRLRHAEIRLSGILLLLTDVMKVHVGIARELVLTAFSLNPTREIFLLIKSFHRKFNRLHPDLKIDLKAISPETGKIITRSSKYDPFNVSSRVMEECREMGLRKEVATDLLSIITNQRFKKLSWMYGWKRLKSDCEDYLRNGIDMRNDNKELKYLKIDYSLFR